MTILWIENNPRFVGIAIKNFLAAHRVTVVPSIAAARRHLGAASVACVLLDYDLDDGKGTELVQEILSLPERPWLIATSSHADGNQALLAAGADAVCSKMEFACIGQVMANVMTRGWDAETKSEEDKARE